MNVGDVITRAIAEYYNNPGTSNDFLTPVMVAHWIQKSINTYWSIFQDNEFGYYSFRDQPLSIDTTTNIYNLPNGSTSKTTLAFSGTPVSGNFVMNVNGTNVTVAYNATASALQTTANTLFTPSAVTVSGGPAPTTFTYNWGFVVTSLNQVSNNLKDSNNLTVQVTPVTSNLNVAFVSEMAFTSGTGQSLTYQPIIPLLPTEKYGNTSNFPYLQGVPGASGMISAQRWCYEQGVQDPTSQYPTASIRFVPWPQAANSVVYGGTRYPNPIMFDSTGQPITTQILDLPLHLHDGVVMYVLREAYIRAKADTTEMTKLWEDFNKSHFGVESRSQQRQGSELIKQVY